MKSKEIENDNNKLSSDIINKLKELDLNNDIKITKLEIKILLNNPKIKNIFLLFLKNVNNEEAYNNKIKLINLFMLNKDKIILMNELKNKKQNIINSIILKKNELLEIKKNKNDIETNNLKLKNNLEKIKKTNENNLVKIKLISNSKIKIKEIKNEFEKFSDLLINNKNKIKNEIIIEEKEEKLELIKENILKKLEKNNKTINVK